MKRQGVTLVEVLCVIVISATLASLLFPVFQDVVRAGKRTRSVAHMKQLHMAFVLYADQGGAEPNLLVDLPARRDQIWIQRESRVPFNTGGFPIDRGIPNSDVYRFAANEAETFLPVWTDHVERTDGNPVVVVDTTFGFKPEYDHGPFDRQKATAIFFDGHVETRVKSGNPAGLPYWGPTGSGQ